MKKTAFQMGLTYLIMWAVLGVLIAEKSLTGEPVNYAALPRAMAMSHISFTLAVILVVLAKTAWHIRKNLRQGQQGAPPRGAECT